jgi:hypothetical protein
LSSRTRRRRRRTQTASTCCSSLHREHVSVGVSAHVPGDVGLISCFPRIVTLQTCPRELDSYLLHVKRGRARVVVLPSSRLRQGGISAADLGYQERRRKTRNRDPHASNATHHKSHHNCAGQRSPVCSTPCSLTSSSAFGWTGSFSIWSVDQCETHRNNSANYTRTMVPKPIQALRACVRVLPITAPPGWYIDSGPRLPGASREMRKARLSVVSPFNT